MFLECFAPIADLPKPGFEPLAVDDRSHSSRLANRDHDIQPALPADFRSESFAEDLLGHAGSW